MDKRLVLLQDWLKQQLYTDDFQIVPASSDASFRRYFRVTPKKGPSLIVMDAPPDKEDSQPFVQVAVMLANSGVHVPELLKVDLHQGFLLLSDLGDRQYLDALTDDSVDQLYADALDTLARIQTASSAELPEYDTALLTTEMRLFSHWLVEIHLGLELSEMDQSMLEECFDLLVDNAHAQPRVFVHRDYHARNLMVYPGNNPGILDFQDAVSGPVTYDLVSLLKDCYVRWPRKRVAGWVAQHYAKLRQHQVLDDVSLDKFGVWFDLMGVQRHLKAGGIFARLYHRDGKSNYLPDIPRTLGYIRDVLPAHPEFVHLYRFIEDRVVPSMSKL